MYTRAIPLHRQRRSQPRCFTLWAAHDPWQTLIKNPFDGPNESLSVSPISYWWIEGTLTPMHDHCCLNQKHVYYK